MVWKCLREGVQSTTKESAELLPEQAYVPYHGVCLSATHSQGAHGPESSGQSVGTEPHATPSPCTIRQLLIVFRKTHLFVCLDQHLLGHIVTLLSAHRDQWPLNRPSRAKGGPLPSKRGTYTSTSRPRTNANSCLWTVGQMSGPFGRLTD
jgi:hypothetical protein